jgi:hypothetical protein
MAATSRKIVLILGTVDQGKTTLARWLLKGMSNERGPLIAVDPARQFPGGEWPRGFGYDQDVQRRWLQEITNDGEGPMMPPTRDSDGNAIRKRVGPEGAVLLLDDADRFLPNYPSRWADVWMANRHLRLDVIVTAHRPQDIPKPLIESASYLYLFNMGEPRALDYIRKIGWVGSLASKMPDRQGLCLAISRMPRGARWLDVFKLK